VKPPIECASFIYFVLFKYSGFIPSEVTNLSILELQKPGKNRMDFKSFYNGMQHYFKVGDKVE